MYTINQTYTETIEIKKSEFIATLIPVNSIGEVEDALKQIRKKYYDATHNCYGYILGNDAKVFKFSDDGEPSQTAGIVIYNVLSKNYLTNVLCVVTRYFGGIKLGAGGLVRAYTNATSEVVNASTKQEIIEYGLLSFSFDYPYTNQVLKLLGSEKKVSQDYQTFVSLTYSIPIDKIPAYKEQLISITNGSVKIH